MQKQIYLFGSEINKVWHAWKSNRTCASADDHLVKKFSPLRKILHEFILGHPNKILTLPNCKLVIRNHLRLKEELLAKRKESIVNNNDTHLDQDSSIKESYL